MKIENLGYRLVVYLIGMVILALGLTLTAETNLGTSPLTAIPFVFAAYTGISFPDATFCMFVIFVLCQILIKHTVKDTIWFLLQIPLSVVFTRIMLLAQIAIDISMYSVGVRLLFVLLAAVLTGVGAALGLRMRLIPNPGDGFVLELSEWVKKPLGNVKNLVDISCVCIAAVLGLVLMHKLVGVGIGSVIVMLGVGRVIAIVNKVCEKVGIPKY